MVLLIMMVFETSKYCLQNNSKRAKNIPEKSNKDQNVTKNNTKTEIKNTVELIASKSFFFFFFFFFTIPDISQSLLLDVYAESSAKGQIRAKQNILQPLNK